MVLVRLPFSMVLARAGARKKSTTRNRRTFDEGVEQAALYYVVERTHLLSVMDSSGRMTEVRWEDDWIEIAPGIEMLREHRVSRMRIGSKSHKHVTTGIIRIHRRACPVHIHFRQILEYNDYFDYEFSSSNSTDYWVRYEG